MVKSESDAHAIYRSLLQKAVRRGNANLVITTCALLESVSPKEKNWVRGRAAVITFEECWPLGTDLIFNKRFHSKVASLVKVARSVKSKDAAGLGFLASALSEGDRTVLNGGAEDREIKIVAHALKRPVDFWEWARGQTLSDSQKDLVEHAHRFKSVGLPRDNAVIHAAGYLAATGRDVAPTASDKVAQTFPYWVAFDKHTPEGRRTLRDIARDLHVHLPQLEWVSFYFEGAVTNDCVPSPWWDRFCHWKFRGIDLPPEEAHLLWDPVRVQVMEALEEESRGLHKEIYGWKMDHLDRIDSLRKQVELFLEHFDEVRKDQPEIF